ncbi:DUF1294 domain-containing protein [Bacillus luteolus]|uniref:DUF1294 domain-containing protein n=1 Tax=Litchfieldia luteola TaxID=682179 RepID=A0ABR9QIH1_9BACI|nr:DUF1294 domain-containing protein [Cytobacillus luteolus]MBE4908221.1 DUF1294 domain-containing protein [Cytobacillus luteolus]MBP1943007.1 uncharacterized membrane protein YsdA (DUF1294 family) [Cytobacillus luteolus]
MGNIGLIALIYIILNFYGYILMNVDKKRAIKNEWRVSEKKLWVISLLGGALGVTIGMKHFRHKTKHFSFKYFLPILSFLTLALYVFIIINLA